MKLTKVAKPVAAMLSAPVRIRRHPPRPPADADHYAIPTLAATAAEATTKSSEIPTAHTPPGRWRDWPPLVLAGCDEPLVEGAPDIRGVWKAHKGPLKGHIERIEQAGSRTVITAGGVIHDLAADGSLMRDTGVGDADIAVVARYEDGRLNLYLHGKRLVVTRYLDGDELVWRWGPYTNRLHRLTGPDTAG